ncbi:MAG TPA: nicotinate phosphoribosyltransferase [Acidimicrobiales bacterium]|nr:nicotinate phosphoribosyltransferase [Acidimicrobiales bacterium]
MTSLASVNPALFCDLYELTMAAAYHANGFDGSATFELFVRRLPTSRNFLVAAGSADALDALERWEFDAQAIAYVRSLPGFSDAFVDRLAGMTFTGSIRAIAEGEVAFADEPLLEITAPIIEAQLLETLLLNLVGTSTMQASKAARVVVAAEGRSVADFSARRDHGVAAAMSAARAAVMAGASSTSLVEAGRQFGLALSGTMAHSYVMAFDDERDAFRSFARTFPDNVVLLLDTWDTIAGAHHAAEVARELERDGIRIAAVRLDSGDLDLLSRKVREILDQAGLIATRIIASGDLDEYAIAALVAAAAPIDAFGVGTRMGTSADAPHLGVVYKLVADERGPKLKLAEGKATLPGSKQVWREDDGDTIGLAAEPRSGRPLLGVATREPLDVVRDRCRAAVAALPERVRSLAPADPAYPVRVSAELGRLVDRLTREHAH